LLPSLPTNEQSAGQGTQKGGTMNIAGLLESQSHPAKARALSLCLATFPNFGALPDWQQSGLMGQVMDVEAGRGSPWLSRVEREKVEKLIAEGAKA
jgi:hypothetical protein